MKLKNKKRLIILLPLLLVVLLAFGAFKGYQSFRYDQYQTAMDMDSMMKLFNMQLQIPDEKKSDGWIYLQPFQLPDYYSFDMKVFSDYMLKKVTFQEIQYKDIEPKWSLFPTEKKSVEIKSTVECLQNFNNNLLYNPEYERYRRDLEFSKPLTMDTLLNNPKIVIKLKDNLLRYSSSESFSLTLLSYCPCPSQYLPK